MRKKNGYSSIVIDIMLEEDIFQIGILPEENISSSEMTLILTELERFFPELELCRKELYYKGEFYFVFSFSIGDKLDEILKVFVDVLSD